MCEISSARDIVCYLVVCINGIFLLVSQKQTESVGYDSQI